MNAKELHELYAPLWALVPETRPEQLVVYDPENGTHLVNPATEPTWYLDSDNDDVNATLCRVKVLDSFKRAIHICPAEPPDWPRVFVNWEEELPDKDVTVTSFDGVDYARFAGPTLNHALVSAAMAVAKAKT